MTYEFELYYKIYELCKALSNSRKRLLYYIYRCPTNAEPNQKWVIMQRKNGVEKIVICVTNPYKAIVAMEDAL